MVELQRLILFQQMKKVGLVPNAYTYSVMLSGLCEERDIKMVKQILQEMIDAKIELDISRSFKIFNFLLRSRYYHLVSDQIIEMSYLGLITVNTRHVLCTMIKGSKLNNGGSASLKIYVGNDLFADTSASEDFPDMAASVV